MKPRDINSGQPITFFSISLLFFDSLIEVYCTQYIVMFHLAVCVLFLACSKTGSQARDSPTMAFIGAVLRFKYPAGSVSAFLCWEISKQSLSWWPDASFTEPEFILPLLKKQSLDPIKIHIIPHHILSPNFSQPLLNTLRTGAFKLFKCTFPGSKQFKSTFIMCFFKYL